MLISSVSGLISLLNEPIERIQITALKKIYETCDNSWPEIASNSFILKKFVEANPGFSQKGLIYAILSKVRYHEGNISSAFNYADKSGLFDMREDSSYARSLTNYALSKYVAYHRALKNNESVEISSAAKSLVQSIIDLQFKSRDLDNILALAVEARNSVLFENCLKHFILSSENAEQKKKVLLSAHASIALADDFKLRRVLSTLLNYYCARHNILRPVEFAQKLMLNRETQSVGHLLTALSVSVSVNAFVADALTDDLRKRLENYKREAVDPGNKDSGNQPNLSEADLEPIQDLNGSPEAAAFEELALQIAFDVAEAGDPQSTSTIFANFPVPYFSGENVKLLNTKVPIAEVFGEESAQFSINELKPKMKEMRLRLARGKEPSQEQLKKYARLFYAEHMSRSTVLRRILCGKTSSYLKLQFLYGECSVSATMLGAVLERIGSKNSISSGALLTAHGFARCGTAQDGFFRRNEKWVSDSGAWNKFSAVASLGVVHKGNLREGPRILAAFMPDAGTPDTSPYQHAGAFYALGLMCSGYGAKQIPTLLHHLIQSGDNEIKQHGASLGLGICSLMLSLGKVNSALKEVLNMDKPVSGESAAIALGLNNMGSNNSELQQELLTLSRETKHNKIVRGLAIAIALTCYNRGRQCEQILDTMCNDENEILRYGGCFGIGMAYVGNEDKGALEKLMRFGVTDVSGDVRRAAILSLVFVLCRSPEKIPEMVKLFVESFNPHSRYAAALAIGLSRVGSESEHAQKMLDPLVLDQTEFVRNGALQAISLLLSQSTSLPKSEERVKSHWNKLFSYIKIPSSNDYVSFQKAGAITALGLLTMGGKHCSISLLTDEGVLRPTAIAGVLVFLQSWFWFPYQHFLSLAIEPTFFLGVTQKIKVPRHFALFCQMHKKFQFPQPHFDARELKKKSGNIELSISRRSKKLNRASTPLNRLYSNIGGRPSSEDAPSAHSQEAAPEKPPGSIASSQRDEKVTTADSKPTNRDEKEKTAKKYSVVRNPIFNLRRRPEEATSGTKPRSEKQQLEEYLRQFGPGRIVFNPCPVPRSMREHTAVLLGQRYVPVKRGFGIVVLRDTQPELPEDLVSNEFIHS